MRVRIAHNVSICNEHRGDFGKQMCDLHINNIYNDVTHYFHARVHHVTQTTILACETTMVLTERRRSAHTIIQTCDVKKMVTETVSYTCTVVKSNTFPYPQITFISSHKVATHLHFLSHLKNVMSSSC